MKNQENNIRSEPVQTSASKSSYEEGLKINGMQQVIDMLQNADPVFRESLLKRLTQRDPQLAKNLRKVIR